MKPMLNFQQQTKGNRKNHSFCDYSKFVKKPKEPMKAKEGLFRWTGHQEIHVSSCHQDLSDADNDEVVIRKPTAKKPKKKKSEFSDLEGARDDDSDNGTKLSASTEEAAAKRAEPKKNTSQRSLPRRQHHLKATTMMMIHSLLLRERETTGRARKGPVSYANQIAQNSEKNRRKR
ncbi:unnamed protein product [Caenorhabditis nigoni]